MLREALTYPLRGEDAAETLLAGAILAVAVGLLARLGVLAVLALAPAVLLAGYAQAVVRASVESAGGDSAESADRTGTGSAGDASADAPPRFANLRTLAVDGVRALPVVVAYLLVPAAALALTVGGAGTGGRPESLGTTAFVFASGTVVLFVSLAFVYLLPAALAGVALTRDLSAGADHNRLFGHASDAGYFVGVVSALLVGGVAGVLSGWLASLGRPGEVVALAGGFYAAVVIARLVGRGVAG